MSGQIVMAAFISPFRKERIKFGNYSSKTNLWTSVDPKGLYQKDRKGVFRNLRGLILTDLQSIQQN